mmetsp:Transcript_39807/g.93774  ORF Transcript_39807/g.93774 Transcript_39807/m.93774 type:complete len:202 (-) Transcript_39807:3112-3717(-)
MLARSSCTMALISPSASRARASSSFTAACAFSSIRCRSSSPSFLMSASAFSARASSWRIAVWSLSSVSARNWYIFSTSDVAALCKLVWICSLMSNVLASRVSPNSAMSDVTLSKPVSISWAVFCNSSRCSSLKSSSFSLSSRVSCFIISFASCSAASRSALAARRFSVSSAPWVSSFLSKPSSFSVTPSAMTCNFSSTSRR